MVEFGVLRGASAEHAVGDHASRGLARRANRNADLGNAKLAGVRLPGRNPVPQLGPVEAHRDVGLHRRSLHLARRGIDAGGDVGRHDRRPAAVDRLDRGVRGRARCPREPGAEDRVHDHPGSRERRRNILRAHLDSCALESPQVGRRVSRELVRGPQQERLDLVSGVGQPPGGDQPVAAVVALAADDPDRSAAAPPSGRPRPRPRPPSPSARATAPAAPRSPRHPPRASQSRRKRARARLPSRPAA